MKQNHIKEHTCCFLGHRKIHKTDILKNRIYNLVENLIINEDVNIFLFGSKSQFDELCYKVVTELKGIYPHIKRIYVRAEYPYIDDRYKEYILQNYESTYYPDRVLNAGRASYVERNNEMIDKSRFCVIYYNENYTPPKRKNNLVEYQPKSGTRLAYDYAKKKGLIINNFYNEIG